MNATDIKMIVKDMWGNTRRHPAPNIVGIARTKYGLIDEQLAIDVCSTYWKQYAEFNKVQHYLYHLLHTDPKKLFNDKEWSGIAVSGLMHDISFTHKLRKDSKLKFFIEQAEQKYHTKMSKNKQAKTGKQKASVYVSL